MSKQPTDMDDFWEEFEIQVEEPTISPEEQAKLDAEAEEARKASEEGKTAEEIAAEQKAAEEAASKEEEEEEDQRTPEEIAAEEEAKQQELEEAAKQAAQGNNSGYKEIALKYIENGTWSSDLAVEGPDGKQIPVSELEEIDEDTFFQIDEAVKNLKEEENKSKFISIEGVEDRRRNIIEIVKEGGDLTKIFSNAEQMNDYINPFSNMDLEDESVQAQVYKNALMKYNKLDADTAQTVVEKAKKDLTLDTKVKSFVDQYTQNFDKYVESKKQEIVEANKAEKKAQADFKKSLKEKYKSLEIDDKLANRLATSAINKKDGEFEIDSVYAQKMEDVDEAAELILFLTDKQAYLEMKMKDNNLQQQKKFRQIVKIIPNQQKKKVENKEEIQDDTMSDFEIQVK